MRTFETRFAERMARPTGALELMADLGAAMARGGDADIRMLGGGNPARIPAVEAVYRRRLAEIAADAGPVRPLRRGLFRTRGRPRVSRGRRRCHCATNSAGR